MLKALTSFSKEGMTRQQASDRCNLSPDANFAAPTLLKSNAPQLRQDARGDLGVLGNMGPSGHLMRLSVSH